MFEMEQIKSKDDYDQCSRLININHMISSELINLKNQNRKNDKNIYSTHKKFNKNIRTKSGIFVDRL